MPGGHCSLRFVNNGQLNVTEPKGEWTDDRTWESDPKAGELTLWVTDAELIRRSGVPEKEARRTLMMLDANLGSGFPKKDKHWGNRRYWPAVKAFWERTSNPQTRQVVAFRDRKTG